MKFQAYVLLCVTILYEVSICVCDDGVEEEPLWRREKLTAVMNYEGIDDLYRELQARKLAAENPANTAGFRTEGVTKLDSLTDNLNVKKSMCEYIFDSYYFKDKLLYAVDPQRKAIRADLKKRQNEVYQILFKRIERKKKRYPGQKPYKNEYMNPFREYPLSIHGHNINVFVFSCLVKKHGADGFDLYFISEEYNISPASYKSSHARPIAARFVFGPSGGNGALELKALAQEPAKALGHKHKTFVEFFFFDKKLTYSTAETPNADPICKLSLGQRIRVCASIFSMPLFKGKYKFFPSPQSVQGECEKRLISFRSKDVKRQVGKSVFNEYTIPCRPNPILVGIKKRRVPVFFFVTRAYVHDKVFLLRNHNGRILLEYYIYYTGVAELDEKKKGP